MHLTSYSYLIPLIAFLFPLVLTLPIPSSLSSDSVLSRDLNSFLAKITLLFPFSGAITEISSLVTAAGALLASLTDTQTSQNDLLSGNACAAITIVFARGTTEPGNVGVLVGPPFFNALESIVGAGNVALQGVDYPASVEGFLAGGDATGSQTM
jgi:cutinase